MVQVFEDTRSGGLYLPMALDAVNKGTTLWSRWRVDLHNHPFVNPARRSPATT
jgi:hypothetical protein